MTATRTSAARTRVALPRQEHLSREEYLRLPLTFVICLVVAFVILKVISGQITDDTYTYLTAGERLNAGHQLYALSPGDRPVDLNPPYWTVPLLSPPLIAVIWRPLAALPADLGAVLWLAGAWTCLITVIGALQRRRKLLTWLTVVPLAFALFYEFGVGNVNPYLYAAILVAWLLLRAKREFPAGFLLAVMAVIKVTPAVFLVWLAFSFRRRAWEGALAGWLCSVGLSVAGAGLSANLEYLSIARSTSGVGTTELSLAGLARAIGIAPGPSAFLPVVAVFLGVAGLWLYRRDRAAGFRLAVILMVIGSPVVYINTFSALLLLIVPWAFPLTPSGASGGPRPEAAGLTARASSLLRDARVAAVAVAALMAAAWALIGLLVWRTFDVRLLASRGEPVFVLCGAIVGALAGLAMYRAGSKDEGLQSSIG